MTKYMIVNTVNSSRNIMRALPMDNDYDNPDTLIPYCDDYAPYGEYGKVYYEYKQEDTK